jgi:hypothetical protein
MASKYKRKYRKGEKITTLDELAKQEFVYCGNQIVHGGWFMSWQFRFAKTQLKRGNLYYAIKCEEK